MGRGAWRDTAHGATKSQTLLSDWTQYNTIGGIIQYLFFGDRLFYLAYLQSLCVLCVRECTVMSNSMDCSLPGSSVYGIFQARILEPGAVSSSRGSSLPRDQIRVSWQADSLPVNHLGNPYLYCSIQFSNSVMSDSLRPHEPQNARPPKVYSLMSIELVMPSNHFILCHPLLLLPSNFAGIRVFSNESALRIRWPKCSASTSVLPMNTQDRFL